MMSRGTRAIVMERYGGPDVLRVTEVPTPAPGPGEVLIDVEAVGVGFSDLIDRMGLRRLERLPAILGYEVAGRVALAGPDVTRPAAGVRVAAFVHHGAYAERVVAKVGDLLPLPDELSFEQGAAIPLAFATAYAGLVRFGSCSEGERVLIHGAGGGVGSAAAMLARALGLEAWGTASEAKHDAVRDLGIDEPIDYRRAGWWEGLPEFDLVLDPLGGRSFRRSYGLLGAGGRLVCYGASGVVAGDRRNVFAALKTLARTPRFNPMKQITQSRSVIGLDTLALWRRHGDLAMLIAPLEQFFAGGALQPVVAARFPFSDAAGAHRLLGERGNVGKVVLLPG